MLYNASHAEMFSTISSRHLPSTHHFLTSTMSEPAKISFVNLGPELPPLEEYVRGKALLQSLHGGGPKMHDAGKDTDPTAGSLYEHLVYLLKLILETQPTHALDQFEELSRQVKKERGGGAGGSGAGAGLIKEDIEATAPTFKDPNADYRHAKIERSLLIVSYYGNHATASNIVR